MTQSGLYTETQLHTLGERGYARERALDVLGIRKGDLEDPRCRVGIHKVADMFRDAERQLSAPLIGLEVGFAFRVSSFAESGRLYAFCRDFREVVEMNARYQKLAIHAADISLVEENGQAFVHFEPHYGQDADMRHITELVFGAYGTAFRWLNWGSGKGNRAAFVTHACAAESPLYQDVFGCPVAFEAEHNRFELFPDILDTRLPTADAGKLALTRDRLDRILQARTSTSGSFVAAVRAAILDCLGRGETKLDCVAKVLSRTPRQLRKDLSDAGLSFRALLDGVRMNQHDLLRARGESFADIADALGYGDQAAFTRAFRRWYGMSPGQYDAGLTGERLADKGLARPTNS